MRFVQAAQDLRRLRIRREVGLHSRGCGGEGICPGSADSRGIRFAALCRAAWARNQTSRTRWAWLNRTLAWLASDNPHRLFVVLHFDGGEFPNRAAKIRLHVQKTGALEQHPWRLDRLSLPCSTAAEEGRLSPWGRTCRRSPPRLAAQRLGRSELDGNASALWGGRRQ